MKSQKLSTHCVYRYCILLKFQSNQSKFSRDFQTRFHLLSTLTGCKFENNYQFLWSDGILFENIENNFQILIQTCCDREQSATESCWEKIKSWNLFCVFYFIYMRESLTWTSWSSHPISDSFPSSSEIYNTLFIYIYVLMTHRRMRETIWPVESADWAAKRVYGHEKTLMVETFTVILDKFKAKQLLSRI